MRKYTILIGIFLLFYVILKEESPNKQETINPLIEVTSVIHQPKDNKNPKVSEKISSPKPSPESKGLQDDIEFVNNEIAFAQNQYKENEYGFCQAKAISLCKNIESANNDEVCLTKRRNCIDPYEFLLATEEELLSFMSVEALIHHQIEQEKTYNYIKDPVNNGSDMYDQSFYERKFNDFKDYFSKSEDVNLIFNN